MPAELVELAPDPVGEAGLGLVTLLGQRDGDTPRVGALVLGATPVGRGDRDARHGVADLARPPPSSRAGRSTSSRCSRSSASADLPVGRHLRLRGAGRDRRASVGHGARAGQHVELVRRRERGVLAGLRDGAGGPRRARDRRRTRIRAGRRRVSRTPTPRDSANVRPSTSPSRASASVRARLLGVGLDGLAALRPRRSAALRQVAQRDVRHRCPPTVMREIRSVGEPLTHRHGLAVLAADALPRVEVVARRRRRRS